MENFDYRDIFLSSNEDDPELILNNQTFHKISELESNYDIGIGPFIQTENKNQNNIETNFTTVENNLIDIIYENPQIEMICPYFRKRIIKRTLKYIKKK